MNLDTMLVKFKQYPILIVGVIISLLCFVLIYVRGSRADEFEVQLQEKDKEWDQIQTNVERSKNLIIHVEELEAYEKSIKSRLMSAESVAINYEFFYEIERKTGVRISTINQLPVLNEKTFPPQFKDLKEFTAIPYNIIIEGDYNSILKFIYLIERERYIIRLDSFNISVNSSSQGSDHSPLTARLECYVLGGGNA